MELRTEFTIYRNYTDSDIKSAILHLVSEIKAFATVHDNTSYWKDAKGESIVVVGAGDDLAQYGEKIKNSEIDKALVGWLNELAGYVVYVHDNPEDFKSDYEAKTRYIMKYFNLMGGVLQLGCLDDSFYREKLDESKELWIKATRSAKATA